MASRKEFEMLFQLNAQMGGSYNSTFSKAQQQIASMQREIQSLNSLQSDIAAFQKQQSAVEATRQKLETLQKQYDNIQQEIKETEGFSSSLENKLLAKQQQIDKTTASLERETGKLNEMDAALRNAGVNTDNLSNESAKLTSQIDALKEKQTETAESAETFGETSVAAFGAIQQAIAAAGIATALKEIYDAYMDCVNLAGDFEETMSTVEALSGANEQEMSQLKALAKELGATTKFTAIESGEAMTYMGMAGWNATQMMSGMDGVLQLAAASGEDLALVSDIVTDNLTAFGLAASDTARFADILASAATNSNTNVSIMGETFKMSASIAGALGYSVEDVAVAVGLMANSGIKGSIAGTALKNTFNGLLEGVSLTADAFGEYEYTAVNADGTMKSFSSTINELRTYFDQMTEAERVNNAMAIAGQRGYNGLLAILNATDEDYASLTQSINECSGAAQRMASIKLDNLNGQLTLMNSAWDALKTTIGEQFNNELRGLYSIGTDLFGLLNSFIQKHPALTKGIMTFVGVMGAAVAALTAYAAITKVVIPLMQLFTASIPGVNIIMGVAAGVAALAALMVGLGEAAKNSADETVGLTASSRAQYEEMQRLEVEYERVSDVYGRNSQEALALYGELSNLRNEYESTKQSVQEFYDELQTVSDAINESRNSYREAVSQIDEEGYGVLALSARLRQLASANDGSNASQAEMLAIIEDLNQQLPGLNLNMESVIENTEGVISAIEARAMAEINAEKAETAYTSYKELLTQRLEAEQKLAKAKNDVTAAQQRLNDATNNEQYQQYLRIQESIAKASQGHGVAWDSSAYRNVINDVSAAEAAVRTANEEFERAQEVFDETDSAAQGLLHDYLEFSGVAMDTAEEMNTLNGVLDSVQQELAELAQSYDTAYTAAIDSFNGQFGLFDEAKADMEATVSSAQAALESQLNYWQSYAANVETLRSVSAEDLGLTQDNYEMLIAYVQSGTEEAAGLAQSMADAVNSGNTDAIATLANTLAQVKSAREQAAGEVAAWQVDIDGKMQEIISSMESAVEDMDMSTEAYQSGINTMQGLISGASSMKSQVAEAYASVAQAAIDAINAKMQIHSPSRVMMEKAEMTWAGYIIQTEAMEPEVRKAMSDVAGDGVDAVLAESAQLATQANERVEIVSLLPLMQRYIEASRGYFAVRPAEPISAQSGRYGDTHITIAPQFILDEGTTNNDMTESKLREYAEIVTEMVIEALDDAGIDAKRGAYA